MNERIDQFLVKRARVCERESEDDIEVRLTNGFCHQRENREEKDRMNKPRNELKE